MPREEMTTSTQERPRSAFGQRRLDKNGQSVRGFTTEEFHETYWTSERREEQRKRMMSLHAEGRAGGQHGFHRRRTKRFQEIAAEHAQARADEIISRLDAMIDQPKDKRLQLEAIREYMKMEDWAVKNAREDEKEFRKLTGAQLDSRLLELMGDALGVDFSEFAGVLSPEVIEGEVVALPECCACDEERARVAEILRDSGVEDEELVEITAGRARCEDHRDEVEE